MGLEKLSAINVLVTIIDVLEATETFLIVNAAKINAFIATMLKPSGQMS